MARKGDYAECTKCTSFQCKTCGLDVGLKKGNGAVTLTVNATKWSAICSVALIAGNYFKIDQTPWWVSTMEIIATISGLLAILDNGAEYQNSESINKLFKAILWVGLFAPLCLFIYEVFIAHKY